MSDANSNPPKSADLLSSKGEIKVWLTATGLNVGLFMVAGLLLLITWNGLSVFWPQPVSEFTLTSQKDGAPEKIAGIITKQQTRRSAATGQAIEEIQIFTGNRDAYGLAFRFLDQSSLASTTLPADYIVAERSEYGKAIFSPVRLEFSATKSLPASDPTFLPELHRLVKEGNDRRAEITALEKHEIGAINTRIDKLEIRLRKADPSPETRAPLEQELATLRSEYATLAAQATTLRDRQKIEKLVYRLASGEERNQAVAEIIHFYQPNQLTLVGRFKIFLHHALAFLTEEPREANTEGGIFPAIFGTFVMTLLMAALVTPLGIIAAIYLHEYAKPGIMLQSIRICVNNLAGVPSIVFGVFGLGFFVYGVGGYIDHGPTYPLPERWWFLASLGAVVTLVLALLLTLTYSPTQALQPKSKARSFTENSLWISTSLLTLLTLAKCPYFHGFFSDKLPSPTFGTGGILWASITLSLMTLPVVIVATEEALSAVPRGVREAALACGASKWQMIQRIALPGALPGVMTGIILAMARGAGEVAPLMITGVVKLAPSLPLDGIAPFIHAERKFMHLGFHIFDLGFQSPDSEAAKPMVFATTLLLIFLVVVLNLTAIQIRSHLRRKLQASAF
jgi:ABC-type phosphate transport system permease subunit